MEKPTQPGRSWKSRFRKLPGIGDDNLTAATVQDRRYGGGPELAVSRLHDDGCTDELRGQHSGIAEIDGAPVPVCLGGGAASLGAEPPRPERGVVPVSAEAAAMAGEGELEGAGPGLVRGRAHERAGSATKH